MRRKWRLLARITQWFSRISKTHSHGDVTPVAGSAHQRLRNPFRSKDQVKSASRYEESCENDIMYISDE
jgi:hypothetical protein